jgi:hypothetical protein
MESRRSRLTPPRTTTHRRKAPPFKAGDRIIVSGPPGAVAGEVLQVATPEAMPQIGGAPPAKEVQAILREWRIDLVLLIAHKHEDRNVCFFALRHPGGWRDLRGQTLTLLKAPS